MDLFENSVVTTEHLDSAGETVYLTKFGFGDHFTDKCNIDPASFLSLSSYDPTTDCPMGDTATVVSELANSKDRPVGIKFESSTGTQLGVWDR